MKWVIAADHAAVGLKAQIKAYLEQKGEQVEDLGGHDPEADDATADFADMVAPKILSNDADMGILICGNGLGVSIRANRYPGVRAALVYSEFVAEHARAHSDANVLCFGARTMTFYEVTRFLDTFMQTAFEGGRHIPRLEKLDAPLKTATKEKVAV